MRRSRTRAEALLRRELTSKLKVELSLLRYAESILQSVAEETEAKGESENFVAISRLSSRTAADVRGMRLLLERGYGLQALTLCASAYEHLSMVAYIGASVENGRTWLSHSDPFATPYPNWLGPQTRRRTDYPYIETSKGNGKSVDAIYTILCTAKHGNPLVESNLGIVHSPEAHYLDASPEFSRQVVRQGEMLAFALARGTMQMLNALIAEAVIDDPTSREAQRFLELASQVTARAQDILRSTNGGST